MINEERVNSEDKSLTHMRKQRVVYVLEEVSCRTATPIIKGVQIGPSLKLQEGKRHPIYICNKKMGSASKYIVWKMTASAFALIPGICNMFSLLLWHQSSVYLHVICVWQIWSESKPAPDTLAPCIKICFSVFDNRFKYRSPYSFNSRGHGVREWRWCWQH